MTLGQREIFFSKAADLEVEAFELSPRPARRTVGILAESAAALLYKAGRFKDCIAFVKTVIRKADITPRHQGLLDELREASEDSLERMNWQLIEESNDV